MDWKMSQTLYKYSFYEILLQVYKKHTGLKGLNDS